MTLCLLKSKIFRRAAIFLSVVTFVTLPALHAQQLTPNSSRLPSAFAPNPAPRVAAATAVSPSQNPLPSQGVPVGSPVAVPSPSIQAPMQAARDNYVLSPNDVIQVQVFQEPDLYSVLRVSEDGTVTFPLIGLVTVGGSSPQAAAVTIQDLLSKDYLVNPQVSVTVTEYSKRHFTILGQVQRPGAYDMPDRDNLPLLSAIGMAGGYTRIADPSRITVKRRQNTQESLIRLNAKKMAAGSATTSFDVLPGDIITVGESMF